MFEELKRFVVWSDADERMLRTLAPLVEPELGRIAEAFYQRIVEHDETRRTLARAGEPSRDRLRETLTGWLRSVFEGPWDDAYALGRRNIGRAHVRIALPQHFMFGAMTLVRGEILDIVQRSFGHDLERCRAACDAVGKILDLELALILDTYREHLLEQHARRERLATFGQAAASIGHELRSPLGVISTSLHILRAHAGTDETTRVHLERIGRQVDCATQIVTSLLDLVRDRPLDRRPLALLPVVESALGGVRTPVTARVRMDDALEGLPPVPADAAQVRQAIRNLLENAVQAAGPDGQVHVRGWVADEHVSLAVEDDGPGVDSETERRLFEPLVTTKESGIGLGLALVQRIADRHGGSIRYEPREGGGARFVLSLPLSRDV